MALHPITYVKNVKINTFDSFNMILILKMHIKGVIGDGRW